MSFVQVHASANPSEIAAVRAALESARLAVKVTGDLTLGLRCCVVPARVFVPAADAEQARQVVSSFLVR